MNEQPLVSVLMTAYNSARYIGEAIASVLASTYPNFELIISDDCSTDRTVEIAKEYAERDSRIKIFVNGKNLTDYLNRNKAASYAAGKYIKYLDSDDFIYPYGLAMMVSCMERCPEAGFGLSSKGDVNAPNPICISPRQIYHEHFFDTFGHFSRAPGSSIIKKNAFDEMGGFSGIRDVGDYEFWLKIGCYYPMVKLPLDMYWSRSHSNNEKNLHSVNDTRDRKLMTLKTTFAREKVPLTKKEKQQVLFGFKNPRLKRALLKISHLIPNKQQGK